MQIRNRGSIARSLFAFGVAAAAAACSSTRSAREEEAEHVTLMQLPAAARSAVEKLTAGGSVDKIDKETEKGKVVYDVEATLGGKHVEYTIAESDGAVLGTETSIDYKELPAPVRASAESYFGGATGLKAMKCEEYGETSYEIEGTKAGKTVEITFDPSGKHSGGEGK